MNHDVADLERVFDFTRSWHSHAWRAGDIPAALGARLRYDRMGKGTLGISSEVEDVRLITLNERVRADPYLEHAVLLHEAGHILTQARGHGFCEPGWRPDQTELPAWLGAGLLAVSDEQMILHVAQRCSLAEIAEYNAVPLHLVAIGMCLRQNRLGIACPRKKKHLGIAIAEWLLDMQERLRQIAALTVPAGGTIPAVGR